MIDEIYAAAKQHAEWTSLIDDLTDRRVGLHVAVMLEPFLGRIFDGSKTIESRFSKNFIAPFESVSVGDIVLLKAGAVVGSFTVASTMFTRLVGPNRLNEIRRHYAVSISATDDAFWEAREEKNYASLLGVADVRQLPPVRISKRDKRGWVVLRSSHLEKPLTLV